MDHIEFIRDSIAVLNLLQTFIMILMAGILWNWRKTK